MRTLRGRIGLALLAFALVTLMAVGGTLWVALRELHRDAAMGSLIELTAPYAGVVRARLPVAVLRQGNDEDGDFIEQLRSSAGKAGDELAGFLESFEQDVDQAAFSIIFVQGNSSYILNPANETTSRLPQVPQLDGPLLRGQVATGTTRIEGIGEVLYAATPIVREPRGGRDTPLILLAAPDNSAARTCSNTPGGKNNERGFIASESVAPMCISSAKASSTDRIRRFGASSDASRNPSGSGTLQRSNPSIVDST